MTAGRESTTERERPTEAVTSAPDTTGSEREPRQRLRWLANSGTIAILVWLVATPVAFFLPAYFRYNPFSYVGFAVPLTAALCLAVVLFLVGLRWTGELAAGAAGGLAAAWVALMLRSALYGTPFGFGGVAGDMMRMSAAVEHYTVTAKPSDTIPGLVSEYPPLYAWLIGRAAALLDTQAWRLLADAEVLTTSAALLVAFLLWRRHVGPWVALAISGLAFVTWADPRKAFEVITLSIFVPWALETFGRPSRARMHWLVSGLLAGFMVVVYQAWVIYSVFAIVALMVVTFRAETDRKAYVRRLALVVAVAFAVSCWYVVPYAWAMLTQNGELVSDLFVSAGVNDNLFPFLEFTPLGALQLAGLVGLLFFYRSTWWAKPLLFLVLGVYAYRLISMVRFVFTEHTFFLHYTTRLYTVLLAISGVLTLAHAGPIVLRRLRLTAPRAAGAAVLAASLAWAGSYYTDEWMPKTNGELYTGARYAWDAHTEPLPNGRYPQFAPAENRKTWFPIDPIRKAVAEAKGSDARPVTLTVDERLYSFLPWPQYVALRVEGAASLSRWTERRAVVDRLAATTDPDAFAAASADTEFGPIDAFVLRERSNGWQWDTLRFQPEQFSTDHWTIVDDLPEDIVLAIRK
ncbi:arabinofuranosyltransferase [Actinomycetes bacterium KLBMP 9797]